MGGVPVQGDLRRDAAEAVVTRTRPTTVLKRRKKSYNLAYYREHAAELKRKRRARYRAQVLAC